MLDTGRRLYMIDQSREAIEQGLRLAAQKWGEKMQLTGTDEFIKQAIEIAAVRTCTSSLQTELKTLPCKI